MMSFSQLPAVKKDTIFGASLQIFVPSYFVSALESGIIVAIRLLNFDFLLVRFFF